MLGYIEPSLILILDRSRVYIVWKCVVPEVKIINRALLVAHVNVEGKEIDWGESSTAEDLEERGEAISLLQLDHARRRHFEFSCKVKCCAKGGREIARFGFRVETKRGRIGEKSVIRAGSETSKQSIQVVCRMSIEGSNQDNRAQLPSIVTSDE